MEKDSKERLIYPSWKKICVEELIKAVDKKPITFYIGDIFDSHTLVLTMIDMLLTPKYDKITFYCHNLGGYVIVFIRILLDYNAIYNKEEYIVSSILRNNKVIKVY